MNQPPSLPEPLTRRGLAGAFLLGVGLAVLMGVRHLPVVLGGGLINPDGTMRLLRAQAWLETGAPAFAIARDGASATGAAGTMLHWTHLLEAGLIVAAAPLSPVLGWQAALAAVSGAAGPLAMGLLAMALVWAVAPWAGVGARLMGVVAAGLAAPVAGYALPGVAHHHIPVAAAVVMVLGWAARGLAGAAPVRAGVWMGGWAALALALSPESALFTLMGFGALGLAWMGGQAAAGRVARAAGLAMLAGVGGLLLADPPAGGVWVAELDRLSLLWLGFAGAVAAAGVGLVALEGHGVRGRMLAPVLALGAVGLWLWAFPEVLGGPRGVVPAALRAGFFDDIAEMRPVRGLGDAMVFLGGGLAAAGLALGLAVRGRSLMWGYVALCLAVAAGMSAGHVRFSTWAALGAAGLLPLLVARAAGPAGRMAALAGLVLLPSAGAWIGPAEASASAGCSVQASAPGLAGLGEAIILADPNETPDLLRFSGVRTVGSLYHRNAAGLVRLRAAWVAAPGEVPGPAVRATGAAYILACPGVGGAWAVPGSLRAGLAEGRAPDWVIPLGRLAGGHFLYKIINP